MPLNVGSRLGHYDVTALIGEGGMGQVYQATDTTLAIDIEGPTLESYYIIKLGEQTVWREPASWEDWQRFNELKALLKKRYGSRFAALTPTPQAEGNLLGDITVPLNPT